MDFPRSILILLSTAMAVLIHCGAREFIVGGKDGWVRQPSEGYNHWAERNRFQVNDTLYFKYNKRNDSVLVVSKNDYYACSTVDPIQNLADGNSTFKFDRSGPFFFSSGIADHCNAGQRLIVVVLAVRPKNPPIPPAGALPPTPAPTITPTPPPGSPPTPPGQSGSETPAPAPAPAPSSSSSVSARPSKLGSGFVGVVVMTIGYVIVGII